MNRFDKPMAHLYRLLCKSAQLNTPKSDFAIIGEEVNGRYYDH